MAEVNPDSSRTVADAVFAERRMRVRYTATLEATCRRTGDTDGQAWSGRVVNISTGGIGLLLPRPFPAETLLEVELQGHSGSALRILRVRVIHATAFKDEGASSWLLGCAFAKEVAEAELLAILCSDRPPEQ